MTTKANSEKEEKKMQKLFGTDGIRSRFGSYPLEEESIRKLGFSIAHLFNGSSILIGRDTRASGKDIEKWLFDGLIDNSKVYCCGVVPTPVLAFLVKQGRFDLGIMITASHNPYFDNGIKIFKGDGEKISADVEGQIEKIFFKADPLPTVNSLKETSIIYPVADHYSDYLKSLCEKYRLFSSNRDIRQLKLVVDCANGAFSDEAEKVFSSLGFAHVHYIGNLPNGININEHCGALHTESLHRTVLDRDADIGIAFDGDGDRLIAVDRKGNVLDGDHIILLIAMYLRREGEADTTVIGTTMANLGFEKALEKQGLKLIRTDVGDKYVYREMKRTGAMIGGEQSGHIILKGFQTGDGLVSALFFIAAIHQLDYRIEEISGLIDSFPQVIRSYPVEEKIPIDEWPALKQLMDEFVKNHSDSSRLVIRYSGTEPKIRVMIESESQELITRYEKKFEYIITGTSRE